jgi:hypothetical protein
VNYDNKSLSFIVSNFKIPPPKDGKQPSVKIPVRLQVFNKKRVAPAADDGAGNSVSDRVEKNNSSFSKRSEGINKKAESLFDGVEMFVIDNPDRGKAKLSILFPKVSPGTYNLIIWVGDPLSGKNDLAVKELHITGARGIK